jgi:phosphonate C-P lyase system protein PhnG
MTPQTRAQGLAAAARVRRDALIALADATAQSQRVDVLEAPAPYSVLLEVEGAAGSFNLTEVVITTARVRVAGSEGYGYVLGWDAAAALAGALCDGVGGDERVEQLACDALAAESTARSERLRAIAATKV